MNAYKVIRSTEQYYQYCDELERLNSLKSISTENEEKIDLLSVLIDKWDEDNNKSADLHPVAMLKHLMEMNDLSAAELSKNSGVDKTVLSKILNNKKGFSKEVIRVLSNYFKVNQEAFNKPYLQEESTERVTSKFKETITLVKEEEVKYLVDQDYNKLSRSFHTRQSKKVKESKEPGSTWFINADGKEYSWSTRMERIQVIRQGISYHSIEGISKKLNRPVKSILSIIGIPQATYNKKKNEHSLLDSHESELIALLTELIGYGQLVFNNELEKFQRWLTKPNFSLGGNSPESLLDTTTGIEEVNNCLNRIESGNFA
jgi:putative toxin-antitoxin system antitoxin component (TIGR02293 family)